MTLKVLFINENIGGHATVHHHLRLALAERSDIEATFVDIPPASGLRRLVAARVPGLASADLDLQPLRAQLAQSLWLRRRLANQTDHADVLHLYTHNAGLLSSSLWRSRPTVVSLDSTNTQNAYRLPGRHPTRFTPLTVKATRPFECRIYQAADAVVANSEWVARSLVADYQLERSSLQVFPFGIIGPDFGEGPAPGTLARRPTFVFVGRSMARKGGFRLLELFRRRFRDRADLLLVTKESLPPEPHVRVVSHHAPGDLGLWDLLRTSSTFVFPSDIDMAPNSVIEAMTAGLPVIARPVGAIPEMVADGQNGLLTNDDHDLAKAMEYLLDHPDERVRMGRASRRRAMERYDGHRTTDQLIDVFRQVAAGHHQAPAAQRRDRDQ